MAASALIIDDGCFSPMGVILEKWYKRIEVSAMKRDFSDSVNYNELICICSVSYTHLCGSCCGKRCRICAGRAVPLPI